MSIAIQKPAPGWFGALGIGRTNLDREDGRVSFADARFPVTRQSMIDQMGTSDPGPSDKAWRNFFRIYSPVIFRFSKHAHLNDNEADEVLARVVRNLYVAMRGESGYDRSKGRFRYYLRTVTNHVIQAVRKERPRGEPADRIDSPAWTKDWSQIELEEQLRACLDRLREIGVSVRDIGIFEALVLRQEAPERVAAERDLSIARIYVIKHEMIQRVRKLHRKLREVLGEDEA